MSSNLHRLRRSIVSATRRSKDAPNLNYLYDTDIMNFVWSFEFIVCIGDCSVKIVFFFIIIYILSSIEHITYFDHLCHASFLHSHLHYLNVTGTICLRCRVQCLGGEWHSIRRAWSAAYGGLGRSPLAARRGATRALPPNGPDYAISINSQRKHIVVFVAQKLQHFQF